MVVASDDDDALAGVTVGFACAGMSGQVAASDAKDDVLEADVAGRREFRINGVVETKY